MISASSNAACNLLYDALWRWQIPAWRFLSEKEDNKSYGFKNSRRETVLSHCLPEAARQKLFDNGYTMSSTFNKRVNTKCLELMRGSNKAVVCTTSMAARKPALSSMRYKNVLIDEAAQSTEPDVCQAVVRCENALALIGDHKQLPATVKSEWNRRQGLEKSMFQRLFELHGLPVMVLSCQYRMHPSIATYPSAQFYSDGLLSMTHWDSAPRGYNFPSGAPVCFEHVQGDEEKDGTSYLNHCEAKRIVDIVRGFHDAGEISSVSIGILAPYKGQVVYITKLLREARVKVGFVLSVDKAQGSEIDVILYSADCSNPKGRLGFVADHRRLNVAMTRAKKAVIFVGDYWTLSAVDSQHAWTPFLKFFSEQNWISALSKNTRDVEKVKVTKPEESRVIAEFPPSLRARRAWLNSSDLEAIYDDACVTGRLLLKSTSLRYLFSYVNS